MNALLRNHSYIADIKYIEINLGKDEGREQKSQEPIQSLSKPKITPLTTTPTPLNLVLLSCGCSVNIFKFLSSLIVCSLHVKFSLRFTFTKYTSQSNNTVIIYNKSVRSKYLDPRNLAFHFPLSCGHPWRMKIMTI